MIDSLYDVDLASFGASDGYQHSDSTGFIKLSGLPLRAVAVQRSVHQPSGPDASRRLDPTLAETTLS